MKFLLRTAVAAATFSCGTAFAQYAGTGIPTAGPYIGASVLHANYGTDNCPGDCDKTDIGGKVFGGYMFTPYLGAELAYGSYGKAKLNTTVLGVNALGELKSSGWSAFAVGQYPIEQFRPFVKIGFARLDNEASVTVPGIGAADNSDTSSEFAWGLGASYMFTRNLGLRGEWEQLKYKFEGAKETLNVFSLGVHYAF